MNDLGCGTPHPTDPVLLCELPHGHDGDHAALTWPITDEEAAAKAEVERRRAELDALRSPRDYS